MRMKNHYHQQFRESVLPLVLTCEGEKLNYEPGMEDIMARKQQMGRLKYDL